jgi:hypothetical protein
VIGKVPLVGCGAVVVGHRHVKLVNAKWEPLWQVHLPVIVILTLKSIDAVNTFGSS